MNRPNVAFTCVECGRVQPEDACGSRAYLTTDEDEPAEAAVYCPECDEREFGVNLLDAGDQPDADRGIKRRRLRRRSGPWGYWHCGADSPAARPAVV